VLRKSYVKAPDLRRGTGVAGAVECRFTVDRDRLMEVLWLVVVVMGDRDLV